MGSFLYHAVHMKSSRLIIFGVLILDVISIGIMIPAFDTMRTFYNMMPWT